MSFSIKFFFLISVFNPFESSFFAEYHAFSPSQSVFSQPFSQWMDLSPNSCCFNNSGTRIGFLWILLRRTESIRRKGIVVFDKKIFSKSPSRLAFCLGKVFADSEIEIWIIPESSIPEALWSRKTNRFVPIEGITSATSILEDPTGKIWLWGLFQATLYFLEWRIEKPKWLGSDPTRKSSISRFFDGRNSHFWL